MIISNATPLIAFARIGRLDLLQAVVQEVIIPESVRDEIIGHIHHQSGAISLTAETWIRVLPVKGLKQVQLLLPTLDRDEAEVIALALEQKARLVLIDELTGRKVGQSLGLKIMGSVGILIQAKQMGLIRSVKSPLETMRRQGVYYSQKFVDEILRKIGE